MEVETTVRRWGNSFGVLIPKNSLEEENISVQDEVVVEVRKKNNLPRLFGMCKLKKTTRELVKEIRTGYNE